MSAMKLSLKGLVSFFVFLMLLIVYSPIIMMMIFSFNSGRRTTFPFESFSVRWYVELFHKKELMNALGSSFMLAIAVAFITLGIVVSMGLFLRGLTRGRKAVFYIIALGIIVPGISYGLGTGILYRMLNIRLSSWTALPVHVVWAVPWGLIILLTAFTPELATYEEAARTLGASELEVFRQVTMPLISSEMMAAALFGFLLSWGELIRSMFVAGGAATMPVFIYGFLYASPLTPMLYSLGTLNVAFSFILMIGVVTMLRRRGAS